MAALLSIVATSIEDYPDPEELQLSVDALREDLLSLEVDRVDLSEGGPAPEGSRAGVTQAVGSLLVLLAPTLPLLEGLVGVVVAWLERTGGRSVALEIDGNRLELTGVSRADQRQLAHEWVAAVARSQAPNTQSRSPEEP